MLTAQHSAELIQLLKQHVAFYREFFEIELAKHEVVTANRINELDSFVVREQAFMLKSRGFEQQREQFLDKVASKKTTLRELIPLVDDENLRGEVVQLYDELSCALLDLKEINRATNSMVEMRLHRIDSTIKALEKQVTGASSGSGYNTSAAQKRPPGRLSGIVSKKI